jgi:hypothetical protein
MEEIEIGKNLHPLVLISNIPDEIEIPNLRDNGACLLNSVMCARENKGVLVVEGLVFVVPKDKVKYDGGIFKHAWNLKDNIHFDLTAEHVWGEEYERLFYFGLLSKRESEYGTLEVEFDDYVIQGKTEIENQIKNALDKKNEF